MKTATFYLHLLRTSIKASISKRGAFLIESTLMIANNLIFFSIWWIFFRQFQDIGGWNITDMTTLMAVGLGSYGLMQVGFGGVKNLSKMIVNGDLDSFLIQPKNLLLHIAGSESRSKGWGHLISSLVLIAHGKMSLPLMLLSMVSGCLVFTSVNIIGNSLPFWMGSVETVSKKYCDSLFLFALYPTNIYSGFLQIVMFTLIPAGVITYIPVDLIRNFAWIKVLLMLGSSLCFLGLASLIFYTGLKRYESGNKFGS